MELDEELCLCFHVTPRKVLNFIRIHQPQRASQLSECFGAGTGCGWCRPYLEQLFQQTGAGTLSKGDLPESADYARHRSQYVRRGGGTPPPGATRLVEPAADEETADA
jgi:bacterioferritin-associated ferredoxin